VSKSQAEKRKLKEFGGNIRRARVAAKLTQEILAERVELHHRTIQKIERGDINILVTTLARIQGGLGCEWRDLLGKEATASVPGWASPAAKRKSPAAGRNQRRL
jgi:transcriptional regulator with XRE-family HTH domain